MSDILLYLIFNSNKKYSALMRILLRDNYKANYHNYYIIKEFMDMRSYTRLTFKKINGKLESPEFLTPDRIFKVIIRDKTFNILDTKTNEVVQCGTEKTLLLTKNKTKIILKELGVNFKDEIRDEK